MGQFWEGGRHYIANEHIYKYEFFILALGEKYRGFEGLMGVPNIIGGAGKP